jgi:streptogramin lyase
LQIGIANAFANAGNLVDLSTGAALTTTPAGNGTVPSDEINTLGNILAACVNSTGAITGPTDPTNCYTLFSNSKTGGSSGTMPLDTATAAINIAHNPGANIATLYALASSKPPFGSALGNQPNDFSIPVKFTGGGLVYYVTGNPNSGNGVSACIAIDGSGNVWIGNLMTGLTKLSSTGAALSPASTGFIGGGLTGAFGIAVDPIGNVWVTNQASNSVSEFSNSGSAISSSAGYTGTGLTSPYGIAIDGSGNAWVANYLDTVTELSPSGAYVSPAYTGGFLGVSGGMAIDSSGDAWVAYNGGIQEYSISNPGGSSPIAFNGAPSGAHGIAIDVSGGIWGLQNFGVTKVSKAGTAISPSGGFAGGGAYFPNAIAIDGDGNVWVANDLNNTHGSISEFSNSGVALSPPSGLAGVGTTAPTGISIEGLANPTGIAIDGSGNVWVSNENGGYAVEFIGAAAPVVTPLAVGVKNGTLGSRP